PPHGDGCGGRELWPRLRRFPNLGAPGIMSSPAPSGESVPSAGGSAGDGIVFISHSSRDRKIAQTIAAALEHRGFRCWISSRDIGPGENFQEAIVRAIR